MKTIVALPGEGIGVEVVDATCELMTGAGMPVKIETPKQYDTPGGPVPESTKQAARLASVKAGRPTMNPLGMMACSNPCTMDWSRRCRLQD